MTLGGVIARLEKEDPARIVSVGFGMPDSYRGYYDEVAFEPARDVTIGSMLEHARSAMGRTFTGYKGGDFTMHEFTQCWISEYGHCDGNLIGPMLLDFMLEAAR